MHKITMEITILGNFKGKVEILSTHNLRCWKFATSCPHSFEPMTQLTEKWVAD